MEFFAVRIHDLLAAELAVDTCEESRLWFCPQILTQTEKFIEANLIRLTASAIRHCFRPEVIGALTVIKRTDRFFPVILVLTLSALNDTSAREPHELRLQIHKCLNQIFPQFSVSPFWIILSPEIAVIQLYAVKIGRAISCENKGQFSVSVLLSLQRLFDMRPCTRSRFSISCGKLHPVSQQCPIFCFYYRLHLKSSTDISLKCIGMSIFDRNGTLISVFFAAVIAFVFQTGFFCRVDPHETAVLSQWVLIQTFRFSAI